MELAQVEKIKFCRETIKGILAKVEPINEEEWEAFETLTSVHKALRKIDLGKISQVRMNLTPKEPPTEQLPLPEGAAVVHGEDSLVEHPHLAEENEEAITQLSDEADKPKLTIRVPTEEDTDYHVIIGQAETLGPELRLTVLAALEDWYGEVPDFLSDEDKALLKAILETGAMLEPKEPEKPKSHRGRPKKNPTPVEA